MAMTLFTSVMMNSWMRVALLDANNKAKDGLKPCAELERSRLKDLVRAAMLENWMNRLQASTDISNSDISNACQRAYQLAGWNWNNTNLNGSVDVGALMGAGSGLYNATFSVVRGWDYQKTDLRSTVTNTTPIPAKGRRFAGLNAYTNTCLISLNFAAGSATSTEQFMVTLYQIPAESFGVSGKSVANANAMPVTTTNLYAPGGGVSSVTAVGNVLSSGLTVNSVNGFSARGAQALNTSQLDYSLQSSLALARWATNLNSGLNVLQMFVPAANRVSLSFNGSLPSWGSKVVYTNSGGSSFNAIKVDLTDPSLINQGMIKAAINITTPSSYVLVQDVNLAYPTILVSQNPVVFMGQVNQVNPQPFKVVAPNVYFGFESVPQLVTLTGTINGSGINVLSAAGVTHTNVSIQFSPRKLATGVAATDYLLVSVTAGAN